MVRPIKIEMHYRGTLVDITKTKAEPMVVGEEMPFILMLKMWFDSYPEALKQYPPGKLGLSLNGKPPADDSILQDGDVVEIASSDKYVN